MEQSRPEGEKCLIPGPRGPVSVALVAGYDDDTGPMYRGQLAALQDLKVLRH